MSKIVTYYFDSYTGSSWTDPGNMFDGSLLTYSSATSSVSCDATGNTCDGTGPTGAGEITQVRLGVYGTSGEYDTLYATIEYDGVTVSRIISFNTHYGPKWSYYDITNVNDTNGDPDGDWTWADIETITFTNLIQTVENFFGAHDVRMYKVVVEVTYASTDVEPTALALTATLETPEATTPTNFVDTAKELTLALKAPTVRIDNSNIITSQDLALTLKGITTSYSITSTTGALNFSLHAPTVTLSSSATTTALALTSTLNDPGVVGGAVISATKQELVTSLKDPTLSYDYSFTVTALELTLALSDPQCSIDSTSSSSALDLTLTFNDPTYKSDTYIYPSFLSLNLRQRASEIQRYIYDPIVKGGCPQCGTLLYYEEPSSNNPVGGRRVRSRAIHAGRNRDRGTYHDNKYVKCARCGFVCNTERDLSASRGSNLGWSINYTEIEAG